MSPITKTRREKNVEQREIFASDGDHSFLDCFSDQQAALHVARDLL